MRLEVFYCLFALLVYSIAGLFTFSGHGAKLYSILDTLLFFFSFILVVLNYLGRQRVNQLVLTLSVFKLFRDPILFFMMLDIFDLTDTVTAILNWQELDFMLERSSSFYYLFLFLNILPFAFILILFCLKEIPLKEAPIRQRRKTKSFFFILFTLVLLSPCYAYLFAKIGVQKFSRSFLSLDLNGFYSIGKTYEKNGNKVSLIPMMHVASKEFYRNLSAELDHKNITVIREGVSDKKKKLDKAISYEKFSKTFGLSSQKDQFLLDIKARVVNGDIDIENFSPMTINVLNAVSKISDEDGLSQRKLDKESLLIYDFFLSYQKKFKFFSELIYLRNSKVLEVLKNELQSEQLIFIPWGALHMPELEKEMIRQGFELIGSRKRTMVYFFRK